MKEFIRAGRLRELVDQRATSSPFGTAVLRLLDKTAYEYTEEACVTAGGRFACNTTQSLFRPEVMRFRKKFLSDYRRPRHKKVLVLLPCSARKPYHTSKTHKAFASVIHTGDHDIHVHEVIVTSPLGAVPRELDVFFPANAYDIPVTGEWKCQEKGFIRELVSHIVGTGYDTVISHLGGDTDDMIADICPMIRTCVGDPVSPASLNNLGSAVQEAAKRYPKETYSTERIETIRSILSYQFGPDVADGMMD
jgi:archaeosine synthase